MALALSSISFAPSQPSSRRLFLSATTSATSDFSATTSLHFSSPSFLADHSLSLRYSKKRKSRRRRGLAIHVAADYYSTLGVARSASIKEIKAAYRKLARQVLLLLSD